MIPVQPQPEPDDFKAKVRTPGRQWLVKEGLVFDQPPPDPSRLPSYWRETLEQLWGAYQGVCAYFCFYIEWPSGACSTDHFIAKSRHAGLAYEWSNYRLSCLKANRNKNIYDDVLDPFNIDPETFILCLLSGEVVPNPALPEDLQEKAHQTIKRLRLNDGETKEMRARHCGDYLNNDCSSAYLQKHSPFVWYEAKRQGLL